MVNKTLKKPTTVLGWNAPNPRVTFVAAFALAVTLSVPVFLVLTLIDWFLL